MLSLQTGVLLGSLMFDAGVPFGGILLFRFVAGDCCARGGNLESRDLTLNVGP